MAEQLLDREIETKAILEILNKSVDNNKIIYEGVKFSVSMGKILL